ncbi:MAG TPA: hypothetical protein VMD05_05635, partial [Candidatus Nanoarchaeia archaeon]|nr:hypothetical protein [Candidatus Nanoarchaeia archaeon]
MAWRYDNAAGDSHASPLTLRLTVGGDSDRLLVLQVVSHKWLPTAQTSPTIMIGLVGSNSATAPTLISQVKPGLGTADSSYHGLFYLLNPPTGADSISVVLANATQLGVNAASYSRVLQKGPNASSSDTWSVTTRGGDSLSIT